MLKQTKLQTKVSLSVSDRSIPDLGSGNAYNTLNSVLVEITTTQLDLVSKDLPLCLARYAPRVGSVHFYTGNLLPRQQKGSGSLMQELRSLISYYTTTLCVGANFQRAVSENNPGRNCMPAEMDAQVCGQPATWKLRVVGC